MGNSGYGATAQSGFHFYDYRISEAITLTGQLSDQHLAMLINKKFNSLLKTTDIDYVIAGDTDSLFLNVAPIVEKFYPNKSIKETTKFLDKFANEVCQPIINKSVDELFDKMNAHTKVMASKREAIASKCLIRAKKNYAMYVHNSEGVDYDPPKLKVQGLEIVRASTPKKCKVWLKECLALMFEKTEDDLKSRFLEIEQEFNKLPIEAISFPRGVSDIDKWVDAKKLYKIRTPIHVRGAILYNEYVEKGALANGDKVKFVYLKLPNPIKENVISFPTGGSFPTLVSKYVDYDTQFYKAFEKPLESLTIAAGWDLRELSSLDSFFGE